MKITIKIECETEVEILAHIRRITNEISREIKKQKGTITKPVEFDDENCYGAHLVTILPE